MLDPDEILEAMPQSLMVEWTAFYGMAPFGPQADDVRAGTVAAAVVNWSGKVTDRRAREPSDFFPHLKQMEQPKEEIEQSPEEAIAIFKMRMGVQ